MSACGSVRDAQGVYKLPDVGAGVTLRRKHHAIAFVLVT